MGPGELSEEWEGHRAKDLSITLGDDRAGGITRGAERRQPHLKIRTGVRRHDAHAGAAYVAAHGEVHRQRWFRGSRRSGKQTPEQRARTVFTPGHHRNHSL